MLTKIRLLWERIASAAIEFANNVKAEVMRSTEMKRNLVLVVAWIILLLGCRQTPSSTSLHVDVDVKKELRMEKFRQAVKCVTNLAYESTNVPDECLKKLLREGRLSKEERRELIPLYAAQIVAQSANGALFVESKRYEDTAVVRIPDSYATDIGLSATLIAPDGERLASWIVWEGYFEEGNPPYPDEVYLPTVRSEDVVDVAGLLINFYLPSNGRGNVLVASIPLFSWHR